MLTHEMLQPHAANRWALRLPIRLLWDPESSICTNPRDLFLDLTYRTTFLTLLPKTKTVDEG